MSIPTQLANKIKSIPMDPLALANNIELAYMQSFSTYSKFYSMQIFPMTQLIAALRIPITPHFLTTTLLISMSTLTKHSSQRLVKTISQRMLLW